MFYLCSFPAYIKDANVCFPFTSDRDRHALVHRTARDWVCMYPRCKKGSWPRENSPNTLRYMERHTMSAMSALISIRTSGMSKLMNGAIVKDQENTGTSVIIAQWALLTIHSGVDTWTKNQLSALWNQIPTNSIVYNTACLHNCKSSVLLVHISN